MHPSAPRTVTVVIAVLLMVIGLALVFYDTQSVNFVQGLGLPADIQHQIVDWMQSKTLAWGALILSPVLLIIGSLVRFI
jgi:hypothetical protein